MASMSAAPEPPIYNCRRLVALPRLDGDLSKPGLEHLAPASLVHVDDQSRSVTWPTTLRAGWTDTHLYLAFDCADADIWATYDQRDDPMYDEEVVEAFLCPTGDLRYYYELEVNPLNAVFDASVFSPDLRRGTMAVDSAWTCEDLETAVRVDGVVHRSPPTAHSEAPPSVRWTVEMAIPFTSVSAIAPQPGDEWRANLYRIDRAEPGEFTAWSPTYAVDYHVPARFGRLRFAE